MLAAGVWFGERSLPALWLLNPKPPRTPGSPVAEKALVVLCMTKHKVIPLPPDLNISIYKKGRVGQVSAQPLQVQQLPVSYTSQSLTAHLTVLEAHVTDDRTSFNYSVLVTISNYGICFKPVRISKQAWGGQIDKTSWAAWNGILPGAQSKGCLGDCSVLRDCWGISPGP